MAKDPDWKIAQNKVASVLKNFAATRKDCWPGRFSDSHEAGQLIKAQPADGYCLYKGLFNLIEVKSSHYTDKFYVKDVQPSQFIGARRCTAAGGRSLFIIAKLPDWTWYKVDGMLLWMCKENNIPGIAWSDMEKIKLTAEEILK
jgi:penicillin-binding protein-related factor A (putative recombinase)